MKAFINVLHTRALEFARVLFILPAPRRQLLHVHSHDRVREIKSGAYIINSARLTCVNGSGSEVAPQAPQTLCSTRVIANFWCGTQCSALHMSSGSLLAKWKWMRSKIFSCTIRSQEAISKTYSRLLLARRENCSAQILRFLNFENGSKKVKTYEALSRVVHEAELETLLVEKGLCQRPAQSVRGQSRLLAELQLSEQLLWTKSNAIVEKCVATHAHTKQFSSITHRLVLCY
jgi:hypothetical protein